MKEIPTNERAYSAARLRYSLYNIVVDQLLKMESDGKINREDLAEKLGWTSEELGRKIGAPGDWDIKTVSDLLLGITGEDPSEFLQLKELNADELHTSLKHVQKT